MHKRVRLDILICEDHTMILWLVTSRIHLPGTWHHVLIYGNGSQQKQEPLLLLLYRETNMNPKKVSRLANAE